MSSVVICLRHINQSSSKNDCPYIAIRTITSFGNTQCIWNIVEKKGEMVGFFDKNQILLLANFREILGGFSNKLLEEFGPDNEIIEGRGVGGCVFEKNQ